MLITFLGPYFPKLKGQPLLSASFISMTEYKLCDKFVIYNDILFIQSLKQIHFYPFSLIYKDLLYLVATP